MAAPAVAGQPYRRSRIRGTAADVVDALGRRRSLCILVTALLPLAIRFLLLPWMPPPEPTIHDEFGHLLVADTLVNGRLTNPTHPLWRHFETIYVVHQPTYSSMFPLGNGLIMAAGQAITGNPWAGVLLAVALMCGATSWMLFGCLPPRWAVVASLLAGTNLTAWTRWADSYWGGAFCAFGGAVFFGALGRLYESPSRKMAMAMVMGIGWSFVWFTRPYESTLLLAISWLFLAAWIIRDRARRRIWVAAGAVVCLVQIAGVGVVALRNRAVTGSWSSLPYHLHRESAGVPPTFLWQDRIPEPEFRFPEAKSVYEMSWAEWEITRGRPVRHVVSFFYRTWGLFVTPWYTLPIALLVFALKDKKMIAGACIMVAAVLHSSAFPSLFPHYIAAYFCVAFFLIGRGMMILTGVSMAGRRAGIVVSVVLVLGATFVAPAMRYIDRGEVKPTPRARLINHLTGLGGRHVVFVRYGPTHNFHDEWVYNAADIDGSPIVWSRAGHGGDDSEVVRYYPDRQYWLADVDRDGVRVSSYAGRPLDPAPALVFTK